MGKFTAIPADTFNTVQMDAGVLLRTFDPENPSKTTASDIICATTGGITVSATPTFSDLGEDVDNCPLNMMELKHLDSWEISIAFTSLGTSKEALKLELGCADIDPSTGAIRPRKDLDQKDFSDIWWVGDKANGGCVAAHLSKALSTEGMELQSTKNGKGQISCTLVGHVSVDAQDVMPLALYSIDPPAQATPSSSRSDV